MSGYRIKHIALQTFFAALIFAGSNFTNLNRASAACCVGCTSADCSAVVSENVIPQNHSDYTPEIQEDISDQFNDHRGWVSDDFLKNEFVPGLQEVIEKTIAEGTETIFEIGKLFDAKHLSETKREITELRYDAFKDYIPSQSFCTFGTTVRSLTHTEIANKATTEALSHRQMIRHLGTKNAAGANSADGDKKTRWDLFKKVYCDPADNNWRDGMVDSGLSSICLSTATKSASSTPYYSQERTNIDIDYSRAVENKRLINIYGPAWANSDEEIDILSLGNNLYGHNIITRNISANALQDPAMAERYLELRSIVAQRSVAENSYNHIVGMKSLGTPVVSGTSTPIETNQFFGKAIQNLGYGSNEVVDYLGINANDWGTESADLGQYATLEILAKKLYQNPKFYSDLYDTPANIKRKSAALKAFELMLDRAIYESELRQELAMSVLLSSRLKKYTRDQNSKLGNQ